MRRRQTTRRGSVYVAILGLSILVAVIGLGGVLLSRTQSRVADLQSDIAEARSYAVSAIEIGRTMIAQDANWRTTRSNGTWVSNQAFGNGQITLTVVNPAGVLNRDFNDSVVLTGTGTKGSAVQTVQVTLSPQIIPCTCLTTGLTANSVVIGGGAINGNSMTIASLTTMADGGGKVFPQKQAARSAATTTSARPRPTPRRGPCPRLRCSITTLRTARRSARHRCPLPAATTSSTRSSSAPRRTPSVRRMPRGST